MIMREIATVAAVVTGILPGIPGVQGPIHRHDKHRVIVKVDKRWSVVKPYNVKLNRMARCESGGRWFIATGNGFYGGLQFVPSTWWSVGGKGMPHRNSILEQKYRAVLLIKRAGYGPWPICGFV
jgi:hypothetical protein